MDTFMAKNHVSVDFMDITITKSDEPVKSFSSDGKQQLSNLFHFRLFREKNAMPMPTFLLTRFILGITELDGSEGRYFEC